jgi:hypothetical protein
MRTAAATIGLLAVGFALHAMTGCSKNTGPAKKDHVANITSGAQTVASSVCDRRILKPEDVAGILSAPIIGTKPLPGDAQSCEFTTAAFPAIIVSVRPGVGRTTVDVWATGKMPLKTSPLAGVGDAAVWQETLHEIIAQKDAVLCDIQVRGGGGDLGLNAQALPMAVGALCNKIFAAY